LQASSVDVHDGNKLDQERSTEVGRALMDASEIRQMTKYKKEVAIISNAPPVRLSFPKLAKDDHPPLSEREKRFQPNQEPQATLPKVTEEIREANDALLSTLTQQTGAGDKTDESAAAAKNQWVQAMVTAAIPHAESFEPEYDPDKVNEDELPLFDFGGRAL
jgi:type IV secretory pathway TraG/TraD family ATPase VirD4